MKNIVWQEGRFFHGGGLREDGRPWQEVPENARFGGFFANCDKSSSWHSHNAECYYADVSDVLTSFELEYTLEFKEVLSAFVAVTGIDPGDEQFDSAWAAIIGDAQADVSLSDPDGVLFDSGLVAQKFRIQVAHRLGYQAVEMTDEHGTSVALTPGVKLTHVPR